MVGVGATVAVVLDVATVANVAVVVVEKLYDCAYSVRPFGPPHISDEFPEQAMLQRPSVAGALPAARDCPQ